MSGQKKGKIPHLCALSMQYPSGLITLFSFVQWTVFYVNIYIYIHVFYVHFTGSA